MHEISFKTDLLLELYDTLYGVQLQCVPTENVAESPIEKILCSAICLARSGQLISAWVPFKENEKFKMSMSELFTECFEEIVLNEKVYELGKVKYRIDIAIYTAHGLKIAVECDGHEFHERTKEQAKRDKEKDRWLQQNGWFVARFTGSEIYKDPFAVVEQLGDIAFAHEMKIRKALEEKGGLS